jgi:hypothetical protein
MAHSTIDNQSLPAIHNGLTQPDSGESAPRCWNRIIFRKKAAKYHTFSPMRI